MAQESKPSQWKVFAQHPTVNFVIGLGGIVIGLTTWWFTRSTIAPVYLTYKPETVARKESPRLTVRWDGVPINNLCVARVALWNDGNTPIRSNDLPASDPLRIVVSPHVKILSAEAVHVSRESLKLSTLIGNQSVMLRIPDGEAIEAQDGIAFRLLYTGDCEGAEFTVAGRVIGTSSGFVRRTGSYPVKSATPFILKFLTYVIFTALCGSGLVHIAMSFLAKTGLFGRENVRPRIHLGLACLTGLIVALVVTMIDPLGISPPIPPWLPSGL